MAQRIVVTHVDDTDGTEFEEGKGETVAFALDGVGYEIDLATKNADKLRKQLGVYVEHARIVVPVRATRRGAAGARGKATRQNTGAVREWAKEQGKKISERGRIPADILAEYEAAH